MNNKKMRKAFSVTLISTLVLSSAIPTLATNDKDMNRGRPEHVIERQVELEVRMAEKQAEQEARREERLERQEEKRQQMLEKREAVRNSYTEEELEVLNENTKNMEEQIKSGRVIPFDSIVSNRKNIKFDTPPVIKGERTLVPLRAISEGFKAEVNWDGETREVTITKNGIEIVIKIDSNIVVVNGVEMEIDAEAELMSGRTYVPLRFIAETLGIKVGWDQDTETIELNEDLEVLKGELEEELESLKEALESLNNEYEEQQEKLHTEFSEKLEALEKEIEKLESELAKIVEEIENNQEDQDADDEDDDDEDEE